MSRVLPAATATGPVTLATYVPPIPTHEERARVSRELASLVIVSESDCKPDKFYAQLQGGYAEITDNLLAHCICPADLLGVPCEWDELLPEGCGLIRLCKTVTKYTQYQCPDGMPRSPTEPLQPRICSHLHWEVDISCRFVATNHRQPGRKCNQVLRKNRFCSAGHDFEYARMIARDEYDKHKATARAAGSAGLVKFGWTF